MKTMADVTVVIPVKDRLDDLRLTVQSVFLQTVLPKEIVIVDDYSEVPVQPNALNVSDAIPVRVIRNEPNLGAAVACNIGAAEAKFPIILFLDSDDCFDDRYVEYVHDKWKSADLDTVCIVAGFWWCTNELRPYKKHIVADRVDRDSLLRRGNFVGGNSVLSVRRDQFISAGGFPNVRGAYDWGLLLRMATVGQIVTLPVPLLYYRSPSASLLSNDTKNFRRQTLAIFAIVGELPAEDRAKANRVLLRAVCYNLAQAGRKKMSLRLAWSLLTRYRAVMDVLRISFPIILGNEVYGRLLRSFAYARASLFYRRFPGYKSDASAAIPIDNCPGAAELEK